MHKFMNALGFQLAWWACVLGAAHQAELPALGLCALLIAVHLWVSSAVRTELTLGAVALGVGVVLDSSLQALSVIHFQAWAWSPLSPVWLWVLWFMFGLTLNGSLGFLMQQPKVVSALLGAMSGPLSYIAGAELGAARFDATPINLSVVAVAWLLVMPGLVGVAQRVSARTPVSP